MRTRPLLLVVVLGLLVAGLGAGAASARPAGAAVGATIDATTTSTAFGNVVKPQGTQTYQQALSISESRYGGRLAVIRYFDGNAPDDWATFTSKLTDHTGIISFRIAPATVISGSADAMLLNWFRTAPTDHVTYWSYMHEPEDDIERGSFTASQFRTAWARIAGLARQAANPQLKATLILMCYTVNKASGRTWTNYYSPGDVDVLGWDCYNHGEKKGIYGEPTNLYSRAITVSRNAGLPWGMAEFGSLLALGDTTGEGRAAWLVKVSKYFADEGALFASYFDTNGDGKSDYRLLDEPSRLAWNSVISDQTP
jgi:hypothetical protein